MMNEFEQELKRIITNLTFQAVIAAKEDTTEKIESDARKAIKQAIEKYVIGKDDVFVDIPVLNHVGEVESVITGESFTTYMLMRNSLRKEQRQKLKGGNNAS